MVSIISDGAFSLKCCASKGYLDGRPKDSPLMSSIKSGFGEWDIKSVRGQNSIFTIKNRKTSEYLCAVGKSNSKEIRPVLKDDISHPGTKWKIEFLEEPAGTIFSWGLGQIFCCRKVCFRSVYNDGYLDGRHTFDTPYARVLESKSYDYTTWELRAVGQLSSSVKIPDKQLDNGTSWHSWCLAQKYGTCTSHAVTAILAYLHGVDGIMPNYIHKYTHLHKKEDFSDRCYHNGNSVQDVMKFVNSYGVPRVPPGKQVQYKSGGSFPKGTPKYTFDQIADVLTVAWIEASTPIGKIKEVIRKYQLPVVVAVTSRRGQKVCLTDNIHPFMDDNLRTEELRVVRSGRTRLDIEDSAHALIFWGYDDDKEAFCIKNSWGDGDWSDRYSVNLRGGNALLAYRYVEKYLIEAYVGLGAKFIAGNLDYEVIKEKQRVQALPDAGGGGGSAFSFQSSSRITSITLRAGQYIDSLTVTFSDGTTYSYGGSGGTRYRPIVFGADEYLTEIKGKAGKYVGSITFVTNKCTYGPMGGQGGDWYSFAAPKGCRINGFTGKSGALIDAIGVYLSNA